MDWVKKLMKSVELFLDKHNGVNNVKVVQTDNQMSPEVKEVVDKVITDMNKISDDEFQVEIDKHHMENAPVCSPDTCNGECQGMGECNVATGFRNAIVPKIINKSHPLGCKCKICNAKLQLGK